MDFSEHNLRQLAARLGDAERHDPIHLQHQLEVRLLPLVRCALRSGVGQPKFVAWVHGLLPEEARQHPDGPVASAHLVAHLLSARLVQQLQACTPARAPALETVCDR